MGLSRTVSETDGDFSHRCKNVPEKKIKKRKKRDKKNKLKRL